MKRYDVAIAGGGLYGASTAYHLLLREPGLNVCIIEPDPSYAQAASARSNAGVRVQFSQAESIEMSRFGHRFYAEFPESMAIGGEPAPLDLYRRGYLIMTADPERALDMEANVALQHEMGCNVVVHDAVSLARAFPGIRTDDIVMATHSPDDMWIDPNTAVVSLMRKARSMGAELRRARVAGFERERAVVRAARLDDGDRVHADWFVNTTGAWARPLCADAGFDIPVEPLPMMIFYCETREDLSPYGVTVEQDVVGFRPEGSGFITLNRRPDRLGDFCWEADEHLFEAHNWPRLAHRVPALETLKLASTYCCHYALNTFDGNLLLGAWPGACRNLLIATGASGHGLQHAPAAGHALGELILDGGFTSLDLTRFGCRRVVENRPDPERGFKA